MQKLYKKTSLSITVLPLLCFTGHLNAQSIDQEIKQKDSLINYQPKINVDSGKRLPQSLNIGDLLKEKEQINNHLDQLAQQPEQLEQLMAKLLLAGETDYLQILIPLYQRYPKRDESLIEWSQALIAGKAGNLTEAIRLYRKIHSAIPTNELLTFQLATALYADKQYEAAKNLFEKLRAGDSSPAYKEVVVQYLDAIAKTDQWQFDAGISLISDPNINNVPAQGTAINYANGGQFKSSSKPEKAHGFSYYVAADKTWSLNNGGFTALHLNLNGSYYVNNHDYDELTAEVGFGMGYRGAATRLEFIPFFRNQLYAGGSRSKGSLAQYGKTVGLRVELDQWLAAKWQYQGSLQLAVNEYIDTYRHLDGTSHGLSNTVIYYAAPSRYFYAGLNYNTRDARDDDDSYYRLGGRLGWGEAWSNGLSTQLNVGYANREYDGPDVFGITRKDKEYSLGASIWHRNVHFWGITPKLNWNYQKVDSNHPFYGTDKHNFYMSFNKAF